VVAVEEARRWIGIELNPEYATMARRRILNACPGLDF
jgi:DNA modification methylase